jgi:N-acetylmuramoyl-L-alanine amidase
VLRATLLAVLALCSLGAGLRPPGLGDVVDIRVWDHATHTRVVIQLSAPAEYLTGIIGNPPRLYIDIDNTWIEEPLRAPLHEVENAELRRVRGGQNTLKRARVVLELDARDRTHRTFHLQNPYRIVTDVFTGAPQMARRDGSGHSFDVRPVKRIAIDAGHGGKDPGALGRKGLREKDVTLRVSLELEKLLDAQGYDAFLTRSRDVYLTLEQRTQIANQKKADLFVSIHANASPKRGTHGVETFLLDTRYDKQTARVAARENGTSVDQLNDLQRILASLRLGYNERFAARLATHVQDSLVSSLRTKHRGTRDLGVKRGPFLVLFMADMPAILIEVGFVSNKAEASRLRGKSFAKGAARGIARGISTYRDEHARSLVATR